VRKRRFPVVGGGTGYSSWVHLDDAASVTALAVEQQAGGVFTIVDDEPAPAGEWLPYLAQCAGRSGRCGAPSGWPGHWLPMLPAREVTAKGVSCLASTG
jgi:nucleoside-diphosphate-sugar epimerase